MADSIHKVSEGNPGAVVAIMAVYEQKGFLTGQLFLATLDSKGIYGFRIHMIYKYHCEFDVDCFIDTIDPDIIKQAELLEKAFKK